MTLPEWVCAPDREPQSQDTFAAGFAVAGEDQEKAADAGPRSGSGNSDKSEQDNHKETYPEKIANAKNRLDEAQIELENARPENEATWSRVKETQQALSVVEREFKLYRSKHRFRFLFDLLSESFDEDHPVVALHRFQMITWTLILGVVFVSDVFTTLRMSEFDNNLLLLTGISSFTYLTLDFIQPPGRITSALNLSSKLYF